MRRLLSVIPIVHAEADLGFLAPLVRKRSGDRGWRHKQEAVARIWTRIREWAAQLDPADHAIHLYQDGLPATREAAAIVRDLAESGSVNHRLLLELTERGATLHGAEDPTLLLREYELISSAAQRLQEGLAPEPDLDRRLAVNLDNRDEFIARRIDETLPAGAHGVLFIGMLHDVETRLPRDIGVIHPLGRPETSAAGPEVNEEKRHAS